MRTFIYQNEEILIEVIATAKLIAIESVNIEYEPCTIKYKDVQGLNYRDTYEEIEPFSDEIEGTLFFTTEPNGKKTKLYLIG